MVSAVSSHTISDFLSYFPEFRCRPALMFGISMLEEVPF